MDEHVRAQSQTSEPADRQLEERRVASADPHTELEQTLELREEQLTAHKDLREVGEVTVRTELEDLPGRLEVDAYREEIIIEHEPVGHVVTERDQPWEEAGVLVMPVYEEQLVVTKRLVLRERIRVRRVATTEKQLFEDTLRRERLVVEDPQQTGLVREQYPTGDLAGEHSENASAGPEDTAEVDDKSEGGLLETLVRKALQ
ncbi:MAG: YsnF/AvaK domain-containing protein [Chloroflexi bacterium]|nr:YsnF/AvaK domain-containing protein [Chloroflexota bacterium]